MGGGGATLGPTVKSLHPGQGGHELPLDTLLYIDLSHAHATYHLHIYVAVSGVCVACGVACG